MNSVYLKCLQQVPGMVFYSDTGDGVIKQGETPPLPGLTWSLWSFAGPGLMLLLVLSFVRLFSLLIWINSRSQKVQR